MLYDHPRIPVRSQMEMGYCKMHPPAHDIISNLPDCMLHHILSFLPTKDAVATCILSTRWRYLWAALSTLDLDDDLVYFTDKSWYLYERPSFMNFVERVLIHRDVPRMKKFRLCCRVCLWAPRVSAWISAAVRHGVQELDLLLVLEKEFVLPRCVFTSDRLRVLKLAMECSLTLPPAVFLPNLKSLQLFFMTFSDESSFHRLFSGCPGLEELRMVDCDWKKLKNVAITAPTLKNLAIDFGYDSSDCVIKVQAPNLVCLTLFGYLLNEVSLVNRLSLVDASIEVLGPYHKQFETARHTVKLLERLQSVKFLSISTGTIMALFEAKLSLFHLPVFHNLTHLEIAMTVEGHSLETLVEFLQGLPCLEYLSFPEGFSPCSRLCQGDWALTPSLRCSLPRLKTINLWFTRGNYLEISILKFLVESAPVLGRITISLKKTICPEWEKEKICAELKTLCGVKGCDVVLLI